MDRRGWKVNYSSFFPPWHVSRKISVIREGSTTVMNYILLKFFFMRASNQTSCAFMCHQNWTRSRTLQESQSNKTPKTLAVFYLARRGMHECMTARMSMSACMMSSPVPHPRTRTHPIFNHEGSATRRAAASRSLTSLLPYRHRRSGLHFSRKRNSFVAVFAPSLLRAAPI